MSDPTIEEEKRNTLTEYLRRGVTLLLIDSRQQGVDVPDAHRASDLKLNVSWKFGPVARLVINTWGVTCVLSFQGVNCPVALPWASIYAMRSSDGHVAAWQAPGEPPPLTKRRGIMGLVSN